MLFSFKEDVFDYGGIEETIGFISDNYYPAIDLYRTIVKQVEEADELRLYAHNSLQEIREREDEWRENDTLPDDFDAKEHEKTKEYLVNIREREFDIFHDGEIVECNKLTYYIVNHMWLFKFLSKQDMKVRKLIGPLASTVVRKALWPLLKAMEFTGKRECNDKAKFVLKWSFDELQQVPATIRFNIENP